MVLVLHADILGEQLPFHEHRLARKVELGDLPLLQRANQVEEAHGKTAAAAQAALGRQVRHDGEVERLRHPVMQDHVAHNGMLDLHRLRDRFYLRIADPITVIQDRREAQREDIDIFIDGHAQNCAACATKIVRIISPAAKERNAQRRTGDDDHALGSRAIPTAITVTTPTPKSQQSCQLSVAWNWLLSMLGQPVLWRLPLGSTMRVGEPDAGGATGAHFTIVTAQYAVPDSMLFHKPWQSTISGLVVATGVFGRSTPSSWHWHRGVPGSCDPSAGDWRPDPWSAPGPEPACSA